MQSYERNTSPNIINNDPLGRRHDVKAAIDSWFASVSGESDRDRHDVNSLSIDDVAAILVGDTALRDSVRKYLSVGVAYDEDREAAMSFRERLAWAMVDRFDRLLTQNRPA